MNAELKELFGQYAGADAQSVMRLTAAGSNRVYYRLSLSDGKTFVGVEGTNPDENSDIYSAPINISKTTTIKAKAWKETQAASEIGVATYVFPTIDMNVPAEGQVFVNAFKLDLKVNNFPIDEAADGLLKVELPAFFLPLLD